MPRFRPRISLLTALLLMTIIGMAISLVGIAYHESSLDLKLRKLAYENRQLRDEVGAYRLTIHPRFMRFACAPMTIARGNGAFGFRKGRPWNCGINGATCRALEFRVAKVALC